MTRLGKTGLIGAVALAGTLAACGGGGNNDTTSHEANSVAAAGPGQQVASGITVTLDGRGSSDPEGVTLTYTWTQVLGPDVTAGAGTLSGAQPTFTAPSTVCTLAFELSVDDGNGPSAPARVQVDILEDVGAALFVDADAGDDTSGDGSIETPYASIAKALDVASTSTDPRDVYVKVRAGNAPYVETGTLEVPTGTSLYGGYGAGWVRDTAAARTVVAGEVVAFRFADVSLPAWFSGFAVTSADSATPDASTMALQVQGGTDQLVIEDNELVAGNVGVGFAAAPGSSYGVVVLDVALVEIVGNTITAGSGGRGAPGLDGAAGRVGADGANASAAGGGASNPYAEAGSAGGSGGNGGGHDFYDGAWGAAGTGNACAGGGAGGYPGASNGGGNGNPGGGGYPGNDCTTPGADGAGGAGAGAVDEVTELFLAGGGGQGVNGGDGAGAGGGGGAEASCCSLWGGGGGGGGQGGGGGKGGKPGAGGGSSIGIWLVGVAADIESNTITTGTGGAGAAGGSGGGGAAGGGGGVGVAGNADWIEHGGHGGNGGHGGASARGGRGGSGAGGPSLGIFVGTGLRPVITRNTITAGSGGKGGEWTSNQTDYPGHGGQGGDAFAVFDQNTSDGFVPVLVGNTLAVGAGGDGGRPESTAGASGLTNF